MTREEEAALIDGGGGGDLCELVCDGSSILRLFEDWSGICYWIMCTAAVGHQMCSGVHFWNTIRQWTIREKMKTISGRQERIILRYFTHRWSLPLLLAWWIWSTGGRGRANNDGSSRHTCQAKTLPFCKIEPQFWIFSSRTRCSTWNKSGFCVSTYLVQVLQFNIIQKLPLPEIRLSVLNGAHRGWHRLC